MQKKTNTIYDSLDDRNICDLIHPEEMAEVVMNANPNDPFGEIASHREEAVKANKSRDIRFWDNVSSTLSSHLGVPKSVSKLH